MAGTRRCSSTEEKSRARAAWYLGYVERLADLGVVEPYEDVTFRPYEPLTRLDMAAFLARAFPAISEVAEPVGVFVDVPADAEGAGAVEGILAAGVTRGCRGEPLSYCPDKAVPRDQMASFLARALTAKPPVLRPGEGVTIRMARANWSTGYLLAGRSSTRRAGSIGSHTSKAGPQGVDTNHYGRDRVRVLDPCRADSWPSHLGQSGAGGVSVRLGSRRT